MKFQNAETGETFHTIEEALELYCKHMVSCDTCPLYQTNTGTSLTCNEFVNRYPGEFARLILGENGVFDRFKPNEKANMDKPLKDWTLGEVNEMCKKRDSCRKCIFQNKHDKDCKIRTHPTNWDLSGKPRFTEQEVEDAQDLLRFLRDAVSITRYANGVVWIFDASGEEIARMKDGTFQSIQPGQSYTLDEIIGGAE